ncbi:cation channel sperm-associated auxiliary subunit delta isoform X4 [Homo sapiens]|uniref:cation channel sperm-associated auxiliary subunit delta isoform X4 n=1 Tax=Homo sapiens TaxID=9606 RepID=UPI0005D017F3|nr:cation channel sperm-associated auxiliary subunit delta isoform X4 [Homo sapiens]|eukprot:XP_011526189.1 cation channel sperm-associated protein subunit delta isoform X4 [Homo sapiens]
MLMLMLVAAVTMWLRPLVTAQLCRSRTVRTGKVFNLIQDVQGDRLYFHPTTTRLIKHPCEKNIALYLGKQVFFTMDNFETSLLPFTIPTSMQVGVPEVTSAHFAGSLLLLVVDQKVYIYDYENNSWSMSLGIKHPVTHVSGDNCCYTGSLFCVHVSNLVFAYFRGDQISQTYIYYSNTGGFSFWKYHYDRQAEIIGSLGGIFHFFSLSQVAMLVVNQGKGMFKYSDHPLNRSFGLSFDYNGTLDILIAPGQRGILLLWFENSLLFSHNAGQLVDTVRVKKGDQTLFSSIFEAKITIHNIAVTENELAVITREDNLYYGNLGIVPSSIIKFADQYIWSEDVALMFRSPGTLEILTPLRDTAFPAFDFQKCLVNIQALLMDPELHVGKCKIEFLTGEFIYRMYTIDMHSQLELTASLIPQPGTSLIPLVMVSNPHSLGFQATFYENGYTSDGNTKYKLDIFLKQQQHWGRTDSNFTSSLKKATMSTLTVDIANKEISCVDIKPLSTLISVGCDLDKKIVIQNKVSACSMGILDPLTLQDNYSFIIEKWRKDSFQEVIDAEYVLLEVNGQFSYSYSLTAQSAMCTSQPQNWTTMIKEFGGPFFWNREASDVPNQKKHCAWLVTALSIPSGRQTQFVSLPTFCFYEKVCCLLIWPPVVYGVDHHPQSFGLQQRQNYVSCHDPNNNAPLRWPDVQYQILGGRTANQIIFGHNGFYVFYISIVDPYYSYCQLETIFSIYVYGAFPVQLVSAGVVILLIISSILGSVWLAYKTPKLLRTARGRRIKKCATQLCRRCKTVCQFRASATARAGTEPPGRHRTPHGGRSDH